MTDTNTLAPSDWEILDMAEDFRSQYMHGGTTFDEFDEIGYTRAVLAKWGAHALASSEPAAVLASGPVGFDHKTAANFLNGKTVTDEEVRRFVAHSRWAHDDRDGLRNTIADLRREIAQRDAEIALLKTSLLDAESPTQAAQALDAARVFWQQHTKSDALSMTMAELHDDVELVIRAAPSSAAPQPAAQALDAQRLTKASKDISTVLRVEGMDLEIGSRKLLKEAREAIDAAIAAQQGEKS